MVMLVDTGMGAWSTSQEADDFANLEFMLAILIDKRWGAVEHISHLVFCLVPVSIG